MIAPDFCPPNPLNGAMLLASNDSPCRANPAALNPKYPARLRNGAYLPRHRVVRCLPRVERNVGYDLRL